jgi:UTP--glucose-1-phosphate uridylyltransferase
MLPVFSRRLDGQLFLKPMLQLVFEQLYETGFREFCFIIGRGKRSIEDHFTIDKAFLDYLRTKDEFSTLKELEEFYEKIQHSNIVFVNQPVARGFGDAVCRAKSFAGDQPFMVHAGDDLIVSKNNQCLSSIINTFEEYNADAALYVERVGNPKKYGVVVGERISKKLIRVEHILEKPSSPPSNIAVVGVYVFNAKIFRAIEETEPDKNDEIQLTDAIRQLINQGNKVYAIELNQNQKRIDIGTPESYWTALKTVHRI